MRHDSGHPVEWGVKAIAHYEKLGIYSESTKLLVSLQSGFTQSG
ncbi:hypothetical protein ACLK1S_05775 [Escherichia coli]